VLRPAWRGKAEENTQDGALARPFAKRRQWGRGIGRPTRKKPGFFTSAKRVERRNGKGKKRENALRDKLWDYALRQYDLGRQADNHN